ncbi:hypothetical protein [Natribacillus halophilus]|uniref:Uncharacterized protein n=1 Tax=Natribacillus halophilus TaxID=549003 RepID=A0A1G8RT80_9BACI|nr:hypothetical protein [Natribacillus halophilus]SDJ20146.1 hypothetical protein SAMN04488123_12034 [Natribacillus halophilus]
MSVELQSIAKEMHETSKRIDKASKEVFRLAKERAETERVYRTALHQEIVQLRNEGMPATLIGDVSRGRCADLKFERDSALEMHRSALAALESIQVQGSLLQTIARYQADI